MKAVLILSVFIFFSCSSPNSEIQEITGETMGTTYSIRYYGNGEKSLKPSIDSLLRVVNQSLSTYIPNSTISLFNRADSVFEADTYFIINFQKAQEVYEKSDGSFDATVMPLVNAWGFGFEKMNSQIDSSLIDSLLDFVGFEKVFLLNNKAYKKRKGVMLDFSALAKGFGVDEVARFLESKGIKNFTAEIGGEVACRGKKHDGSYWAIGVEKPINDVSGSQRAIELIIPLENSAMATSGNYRNFYIRDGKKYTHEINPKTGYPVDHNLLSATVIANDCMTADAWATAFMVMGLNKSKQLLSELPELDVFFIYANEDGSTSTYASPGMEKRIAHK
jgi:thiamine biosynthesis lipoprotein